MASSSHSEISTWKIIYWPIPSKLCARTHCVHTAHTDLMMATCSFSLRSSKLFWGREISDLCIIRILYSFEDETQIIFCVIKLRSWSSIRFCGGVCKDFYLGLIKKANPTDLSSWSSSLGIFLWISISSAVKADYVLSCFLHLLVFYWPSYLYGQVIEKVNLQYVTKKCD